MKKLTDRRCTDPEIRIIRSLALTLAFIFFLICSGGVLAASTVTTRAMATVPHDTTPDSSMPVYPSQMVTQASQASSPDPLDNWYKRYPSPPFKAVVYGNDMFVAVGDAGTVVSSSDGVSWTTRPLETGNSLRGIAYGSGTFAVVGQRGTVITSSDGVTWSERSSGTTCDLYGITYGDNMFVAVGYEEAPIFYTIRHVILTSPDGITWTKRLSGTRNQLKGVAFGNNSFVAVGFREGTSRSPNAGLILTSPDGKNWTERWSGLTRELNGVAYGNGTFVGVSDSFAGSYEVVTSSDGIAWTARSSGTGGALHGIGYANNTFVTESKGFIFTSLDGIIWTQQASLAVSISAFAYGNDTTVAVGTASGGPTTSPGVIFSSTDGTTWTERVPYNPYLQQLYAVAYGNNIFVTMGTFIRDNSATFLTSVDGTTWTERILTAGIPIMRGVTFGGDSFVAVGERILSSPDGITWTSRSSLMCRGLNSVAYGNSTFVAVGRFCEYPTDVGAVFTSSDGAEWTTQSLGTTGNLSSVTYGNNTFVALAEPLSGSDANIVLTSPDGITWTQGPSLPGGGLLSITSGNNIFVAVGGRTVSDGRILTSPDGNTWTEQSVPAGSGALLSVTYGNNTFVAVGWYGIVLTSADGATWTTMRSTDQNSILFGVTHGKDSFVAVGTYILQSGKYLKDMTVSKSGAGLGSVMSSPAGIDCGETCAFSFEYGATVTLTAVADPGSVFKSWSGCTLSSGIFCTVIMGSNKTVSASFALANPVRLTVFKVRRDGGNGTVTGSAGGISCGSTCSALFRPGTSVTLTSAADPASNSVFAGWSVSGCTGDTCVVAMDKAYTVKATFFGPQTLTVRNSSVKKGKGTVTSDTGGISCESGVCKGSFMYNTSVTLSATADSASNSVFKGWSLPSCPGTDSCTITLDKAKSVKATFLGPP